MTTLQQAAERYIRNSIRAYLEGAKNEKWILGVAGAVNRETLSKALAYHGYNPRLNFLRQAFSI